MEKLKRIQELFQSEKRVRLLAVLGAVGVLLICLSEFITFPTPKDAKIEASTTSTSDYCDTTEDKLENIIAQVAGAGRVQVMITFNGGVYRDTGFAPLTDVRVTSVEKIT